MKKLLLFFAGVLLVTALSCTGGKKEEKIKIGFLVKMPEEQWFQDEWKFAEQAGAEKGFEIIKIGATDGEKVISAIDNLAAQGAKGFIICAPDTKLGPAIFEKSKALNLKLMSVDDRFVDANGNPIEEVHHMGISAYKIGEMVGESIWTEMQNRGWKIEDTMAMSISFDELQTAKERTSGAIDTLVKKGFPKEKIIAAPEKTTDVNGGFDAANIALTKNPKVKQWIMFSMNDEGLLGGVRATEGRGYNAENVIAVGIGGTGTAVEEFKKAEPTGYFATVCISPKRHGYETAMNMYEWIQNGKEPEKLIYTAGMLMTRDNMSEVRKAQGFED